jgi:cyanate lyase
MPAEQQDSANSTFVPLSRIVSMDNFDRKLRRFLVDEGYLFPITDAEIERALKECEAMQTEIDTIKITMTIQEAKEFGEQMNAIFDHFASAVNSVGQTSVEQLMLDYPAVSKFYEMMKIYSNRNAPELPW